MSEGQIMCIVTNIYLLLSVQVMQVLACSHMMVEKPSLLKRLNMTSITTSFLTSDSTLRLYNSVFYTLIFPFDYHITRHTLFRILYDVLLIHQTIHLGSKNNELHDTRTVVFVLENGSWQLLVEVEERWKQSKLALVHFLFVIVHELSIEVVCVIHFQVIERFALLAHLVNDVDLVTQLYDEWIPFLL